MGNQRTRDQLLQRIKKLERVVAAYKRRDETLGNGRDFNEVLVEAMPAFCVIINSTDGKVLMMNEVMLTALGYTLDEVMNKDYLDNFVPVHEHERLSRDFELRRKSVKPSRHINHVLTRDGKQLLVEWHGRSIAKENGEIDCFFGIGIDISGQERAENKLKAALAEIQRLKERYQAENIYLRQEMKITQGHKRIIGHSKAVRNVLTKIELVADTDSSVLILGETGTGKELVVDALHDQSHRSTGPLIKVNCSALTETILESELFGHVKGGFSGAVNDKVGRIQAAEGGTLFLDEIGEISSQTQVKLLRFLDNKEYERVGESTSNKADVRIVAATNADLKSKVDKGTFRSDLFYRLNIMSIDLPPLRKREGDTLVLVKHFLDHYAQTFGKEFKGIDHEVMKIFLDYAWPGNVRELKHAVEHACLLCRGKVIRKRHLPLEFQHPQPLLSDQQTKDEIEAQRIVNALEQTNWQKSQAAVLLGVHRSTLYRMMDRYHISKKPRS